MNKMNIYASSSMLEFGNIIEIPTLFGVELVLSVLLLPWNR